MENWRQSFAELSDYVSGHPGIIINQREIIIPDDLRPDFYRLFARVREQYIMELYPSAVPDGKALSDNFNTGRDKALACLNLKAVKITPKLERFLRDPLQGLMCELFDPLFRVLQGITDLATFERVASDLIKDAAKAFLHEGFEHWVTLSLVHLLAPDEINFVPVPDETAEFDLSTGVTRPGWYTVEIPDMATDELLALDVSPHTPVLVPKAILHSPGLNTFVSIGTDFHEVYRQGYDLSQKIEWLNIAEIRQKFGIGDLWPDIAIYLHDDGKELRVVHDYFVVARPDIIIDVMEAEDWYEKGGLESARRHHEILRPRLGSFVICREPLPQPAAGTRKPALAPVDAEDGAKEEEASTPADPLANLPPGIHVVFAGYEAGLLKPVIDAIAAGKTCSA